MAHTVSPSYYRWLALGLVLGLGAVGVLAWLGIPGPGLFGLQTSITAVTLAVGVVSVVLLFFLLRVGDILSVERSIHDLLQTERERLARERTTVYEFTPVVAATPAPPAPPPVAAMPTPTATATSSRPSRRRLNASDERHHVLELEGIGSIYASRLNSIGIISIPQLVAADPEKVGESIDAMPELVREWQCMADLIRVKGIGAQTAELLVRAGINSVSDLADADAEDLSRRCRTVEADRKVRVQGLDVTPAVARRWIRAARRGEVAASYSHAEGKTEDQVERHGSDRNSSRKRGGSRGGGQGKLVRKHELLSGPGAR